MYVFFYICFFLNVLFLDIAVGGLQYQKDHTKAILQMALDMVEALEIINRENNQSLKIRIGVSCGPCVGKIFFKEFSY